MSRCLPSIRATWSINAIAGPSSFSRPRPCVDPRASLGARRTFCGSLAVCSGHNRWSKIKHKKGAADAVKSQLFSRLTGEVYRALRPPNSADPNTNSALATAMQKAKDAGVPKSSIENALARARAVNEGGQSIVYEAVGPGGREAFVIECVTPNANRTVQRVKEILHKNNCKLAPVSYLFEKKGVIVVTPTPEAGDDADDALVDLALTHDAEDFNLDHEDGWEIIVPMANLTDLTTAISEKSKSYNVESSEIAYLPTDPLAVVANGEEGDGVTEDRAEVMSKVAGILEEESEVVKVWTNIAF